MNVNDINFSFEALRWIVIAVIGIYSWLISRQSASSAELLELRTRITTLEAQMKQVPSQAQLHELVAQVARIGGAIDAVNARIEPLSHSTSRIENYLLNQK